jgi:hypothetical protein
MKYAISIDISLSRDRVVELFDSSEHYRDWQDSLVRLERIDGVAGQVGTKMWLHHKMGKRDISMLETVMLRDLPERYSATYETHGVWNEASSRFYDLENGHTRWELTSEFRCSGFMWLMTKLMPGSFKKQTSATMKAFKDFAEGSGSASSTQEPDQTREESEP